MQQPNPDMAAQFALKAALRKSMNRTLRAMSETELRDQSAAVAQQLFKEPFFKSATTVGCYLSMAKGELRTDEIVAECLKQGKKLYIPYLPPPPPLPPHAASRSTDPTASHSPSAPAGPSTLTPPSAPSRPPPTDMRMLRLYSLDDMQACPLDKWGILDPGEDRKDAHGPREDAMDIRAPELELILVPGVAFDAQANRLGRGKAYYDRFLAHYVNTRRSPLLVALALSPQLLSPPDQVPTTPNDFQLDAVLSPSGQTWRPARTTLQ